MCSARWSDLLISSRAPWRTLDRCPRYVLCDGVHERDQAVRKIQHQLVRRHTTLVVVAVVVLVVVVVVVVAVVLAVVVVEVVVYNSSSSGGSSSSSST